MSLNMLRVGKDVTETRGLLRTGRDPLALKRILGIDQRRSAHRCLGLHRRRVMVRTVEIECTTQIHVELPFADEVPGKPRPAQAAFDRRADRIYRAGDWR